MEVRLVWRHAGWEFARQMIYAKEIHAREVDKMLRKPGRRRGFQTCVTLP